MKPQDLRRSGRYRRALVERGDALVQIQLGAQHTDGIEIDRNCEEAAWRFREATEQGDAEAAFSLAEILVSGQIYAPARDYIEALKWCIIAEALGENDDHHLKSVPTLGSFDIELELSPSQSEEAEKLAQGWLNEHKK